MNITTAKAQAMVDTCVQQLKSIGLKPGEIVKVSLNNRLIKVNGRCISKANKYSIEIATKPSEIRKESEVMNTVMHEVLHTIDMSHGSNFQRLANIVNVKFGYNVQTKSNDCAETMEARKEMSRWILRCDHCGKDIAGYARKPSKNFNHYNHIACGSVSMGKLKLIQNF